MKFKKVKIFSLVGIGFIAFFLIGFNWVKYWSPDARKAWSNVENSKKVKVGMQRSEMLEIMGSPKDIRIRKYFEGYIEGDSVYYYHPPFAASSGISIVIRSDSVFRVYAYEPT